MILIRQRDLCLVRIDRVRRIGRKHCWQRGKKWRKQESTAARSEVVYIATLCGLKRAGKVFDSSSRQRRKGHVRSFLFQISAGELGVSPADKWGHLSW